MTESRTAEGTAYDDQNTGSETSFARAEEWLRECMLKHDHCNEVNTPKGWVPSRLIDVGIRYPFPDTIKLRETKSRQTPIRYAALSHCWGAMQPIQLLKGNLQALMDGIPTADLPKTFQDAVYVTQKFGIQYLWIDSLRGHNPLPWSHSTALRGSSWSTKNPASTPETMLLVEVTL